MIIIHRVIFSAGHIDFRSDAEATAWRDANAPGATIIQVQPPTPQPERWRVSKDTMLGRVEAAGMVPQVMAAIASMPPETQFLWTNYAWFWNDNAQIVAMCQAFGLDPAEILARDEFI
jgi:hypothetical protein